MVATTSVGTRIELARRLAEIDEKIQAEYDAHERQRGELEGEHAKAQLRIRELGLELEREKGRAAQLRTRIDQGPSDTDTRQRRTDHLAALASACRFEIHQARAMLSAFAQSDEQRAVREAALIEYSRYEEDRTLVDRYDADPSAIEALDPVFQGPLLAAVDAARPRLAALPQVERPSERARVFAGEGQLVDGRYVYLMVWPARPSSLCKGEEMAVLTANVLAAGCAALSERAGVHAPMIVPLLADPVFGPDAATVSKEAPGLLAAFVAENPGDEAGTFDLALEDEVKEWDHLGVEIEMVTDGPLLAAMAEVARLELVDTY